EFCLQHHSEDEEIREHQQQRRQRGPQSAAETTTIACEDVAADHARDEFAIPPEALTGQDECFRYRMHAVRPALTASAHHSRRRDFHFPSGHVRVDGDEAGAVGYGGDLDTIGTLFGWKSDAQIDIGAAGLTPLAFTDEV